MTTFAPDMSDMWVQNTYKVNGCGWYYASDLPGSAANREKGCSGERGARREEGARGIAELVTPAVKDL